MSEATNGNLIDVSKLPVEKAVVKLIEYAVSQNASDLFLVADAGHYTALARLNGLLQKISMISQEQGIRYVSSIRANARMDGNERNRPSDGRWIHIQDDGPTIDLRINVVPTLYGEDMAMRILVRESQLYSLDRLGLSRHQLAQFVEMVDSPGGLILLTGPTGSGKSATLYSALIRLNDGKRKINTIEDPIEYAIEGLRQSQVNTAVGIGFPDLLRSVLRQSPDVIMIGEIRDAETAETAVRAANSGQLVLATIHAVSAAAGIQSMRALGAHPHFLASAIRGVVSQRLVRTLCPKCKTSFDISDTPHIFEPVRAWLSPGEGNSLFAAQGCEFCQNQGYAGRTGVFEIMPVSKSIRGLIAESRPTLEILARARDEKMLEFRQAALLKVAQGQTSTEEVFRVVPSEQLLIDS